MSTSFRVAIIGCGSSGPGRGGAHSIGYAHAWAYTACPEVALIAVADCVPQNAQDFAAEFSGTTAYTDFREMLAQERPDVVSICTYPRDREPMVMAALEAGVKGVWVEKPMALSLNAARRMMVAAEAHGARLFVNHQRRYGLPFAWMKAAVEEKIGEVLSFDITQQWPNLLDFGPHLVDSALYCLGERRAVRVLAAMDLSAPTERQGLLVENQVFATIHLSDGSRLTYEAGQASCAKLPTLRVQGSEGFAELYAILPEGKQSIFRARYAGEAEVVNPATNEHFHHSEDPALYVKRAAADIVLALTTGCTTRIDVENAYRGLEILLAIYESARLQRMVSLPLEQGEFPLDLMTPATSAS
ncbi:MAG TPA: Gfo/Idh/MocA family oxidoreductase [Armatimonadota bacterium]|jgi:predicted dehydrogenase